MSEDVLCPEDEEVKVCGACDQYCNGTIRSCHADCQYPECGCKDDYRRSEDGRCIREDECQYSKVQSVGCVFAFHPVNHRLNTTSNNFGIKSFEQILLRLWKKKTTKISHSLVLFLVYKYKS